MEDHKRQKILIIDDEPANIGTLSSIIGEKYEVVFALDCSDALDLAASEAPDLILLDVAMPGHDGYTVCQKLKSISATKDIPIIFVTAMDRDEDEARGLELGAIDYITRPLNASIVKARIRNHLELKQHRDFLLRLSNIDGLTGLANRRHFDHALEQEWRRGCRAGSCISIIMLDIDHFKAFNDTYGHIAGDDCMKMVANAIAESIGRPMDVAARYGGEEFVCLLPETDERGALHVAEKILDAVRGLQIPHAQSKAAGYVTVSAGVSTAIAELSGSFTALLAEADRHLYMAKHGGRNRISQRTQARSNVSLNP